jgi:hypothetical protein
MSQKPHRVTQEQQGGELPCQLTYSVGHHQQQAFSSHRHHAAWRAVAWHIAARLTAQTAATKRSSSQPSTHSTNVRSSNDHPLPGGQQSGNTSTPSQLCAWRVRLLGCIASQHRSHLSLAVTRKAWRSVRAGLVGQQQQPYTYTRHQAAALLSSVARLGYQPPPSDLVALTSLALPPLDPSGGHWGGGTCMSQLAQVVWAASHAARWSASHRRALTSGQASGTCHVMSCRVGWYLV